MKPVFETRIHRTSIPVRKNISQIEVALDRGQISAGRRSTPIGELELGLKRGKVSEVFKLARQLTERVPATVSLKSKSQQGYDLIKKKETQASHAEKISLRQGTSTVEAFRAIGRSALRQIAFGRGVGAMVISTIPVPAARATSAMSPVPCEPAISTSDAHRR
jgi:triphosphatase